MMNDFEKIGTKHGTDKVTHHGYHRFYDFFLKDLRGEKIKMLEIGIEHKHSLRLWLDYFPKAFIYGIDKDIQDHGNRYQIFQCRQEDITALDKLALRHLDLIVDDGSHLPEHQLLSFDYLFQECLKPGGIYIIEDIETSYWRSGNLYHNEVRAGYKEKNNIVEIFKSLADEVNKEFIPEEDYQHHDETHPLFENCRNKIGTITFAQNCIIIKKKDFSYEKFDNREYRFRKQPAAAAPMVEKKKKFSVYQSFFSAATKKHLDPGFIPVNNSGKLTDIYENQILLDIFRDRKTEWCPSDYTGLVSWRFFEKCNLTSEQVFARIESDPEKKQVYLLTPKQYIGKFPAVFSPFGFRQTTELCELVDEEQLLPFTLRHRDTEPIINFCNFWLATPEIFSDYIENVLQPAVNFLRTSKSKKLNKILGTTVKHNYRPYPPEPFFLEGLFQCYLHHKNYSYDYIFPEHKIDSPPAHIRIKRRIDFGAENRLENIIAHQL